MTQDPMYHDGMRRLQDARDTRRLADRLARVTLRTAFTKADRTVNERCAMIWSATANDARTLGCVPGRASGLHRVLDDRTLCIPDYDGNGMYRSWGNVLVNAHVGLLLVDFERQKRLRVNGTAHVSLDDPLRAECPGSVFIIRVTAERILCNTLSSVRLASELVVLLQSAQP